MKKDLAQRIAAAEKRLYGKESEPIYYRLAHARKEFALGNYGVVARDLLELEFKMGEAGL